MVEARGIDQLEKTLRGVESEIEDFEERLSHFTRDQWIEWAGDWLNYLVVGVSVLVENDARLTQDQQNRFGAAAQKLRTLRPLIDEKQYTYPDIIDQVTLPD